MTLTRGARITGTILCIVLAVIDAGWIVRDLRALDGAARLWDSWAGVGRGDFGPLPATGAVSAVLLVATLVVAATVPRSPVAASALAATGIVTVLLRLPGVWSIGSSWLEGRYEDELRTRGFLSTFVTLAAALALVVIAAAGRRPAEEAGGPPPTRPDRGASVLAFLALGVAGAVTIAWEIRIASVVPSYIYPEWYTGGNGIVSVLTEGTSGWNGLVVALLCLVAAVSALVHAVHARPLGMIAAALTLVSGGLGVYRAFELEQYDVFSRMRTEEQLSLLSSHLLLVAGAVALVALARRGVVEVPGARGPGYGPGEYGAGGPAPWRVPGPQGAGYGYPQGSGPGYGYPQDPGSGPRQGPAQGPGHGYPQGGGQGPPPPSSPPPNW
ncbi:hypothetical protein [uncultured Streptomyces sp.]|uniref:hypothetical protein n=1 Tax=uncultured Streptomyces sp. TaxID=174707 RepID=UPI00261E2D63|nr:hypothetical protein [uncultured Streptomyces sp.]